MRILLSNDDGVYAKGLVTLQNAVAQYAEIVTFAPDRNRSGASNSLTLDRPLRVKQISDTVSSVEGTPTDCVHLALTGLLRDLPDMVISGINEGDNLGDNVLYSGTVAAAMEGRFLGFTAIAISLAGEECKHYDTAAMVVRLIVQQLKRHPLPTATILNVNVPDVPFNELKGFEATRLGTRHKAEPTIIKQDPRGKTVYWIGAPGPTQDAGPGTDFHAISEKKVSITPIEVDITKRSTLESLVPWLEDIDLLV